ncbi:AMP-binding protein [Pseudonocardia sp. NPDC049154]|uniref:AMP-binding protein n=1 Tax=Pseudonocardia sp. NPDC049154 TaxID=3155501 RepID=UPI00340A6981
MIARWAEREPGRPFLVEVTGRTATCGEGWDLTRRWAGWLATRGVRRGDRLVTLVPTSIDSLGLWWGAALLGALEVPVNPELRGTSSSTPSRCRRPGSPWSAPSPSTS